MNIRKSVLDALDTTSGLMDRPDLASMALSGSDFDLSELDMDSLSSYEVIMQLEDEFSIEISPTTVQSAQKLSDLVDVITLAVAKEK